MQNSPLRFADPGGFQAKSPIQRINGIETVTVTAMRDRGGAGLATLIAGLQGNISRGTGGGEHGGAASQPGNVPQENKEDEDAEDEDTIEEVVVTATAVSKCWSPPSIGLGDGGGTRTPDYAVFTVPVWRFIGATVTIDREGNVYIGPSIGVNFLSRSGRAAGVGWTGHENVPTSEQLQSWLSGASANLGVAGVGFTWSSPQQPGRLDPERFGTNLQVSGVSVGWNFHVADINLLICH